MSTLTHVPVVDLNHFVAGGAAERAEFVRVFGEALRTFGFVRIQGHGIDAGLIRRTYTLFEQLFALDETVKAKYEKSEGGQRGFVSFGKEHAKNKPLGDLKEFWHVGRELPEGHTLKSVYPDNIWPGELPDFRRLTLGLYDALERAAVIMLRALAEYFRIGEDSFLHMTQDGNSILRAIHYPPLLPGDDPQAVRAAAHEDINLITLLCEATTSGLEILTRDGHWLPIDTLEGQIVVDAGDMLARVTNEVIPSTTHRVINPPGAANVSRYSLPFFVHPQPACVLECLPCCITAANPRRYPPVTTVEFLKQRLQEIGLLKNKM